MILLTFGGGPPLSESELRAFELEYRVTLPPAYRRFLVNANGGRPERDLFELAGGTTVRVRYFFRLENIVAPCNLGWIRRVLAARMPDDFLAIATTAQADKICVSRTRCTSPVLDGVFEVTQGRGRGRSISARPAAAAGAAEEAR